MKLNFLRVAYAHCDIPCKIYDPHHAQMAAHSVIRMIDMIGEVKASSENPSVEERKKIIHDVSRFTKVKEEHAELVKHEIRVIWGDYFKEEQIKEYPKIHEIVHKIMQLASQSRQTIDRKVAEDLLSQVLMFSEIFYKSKGLTPVRVKSPYPTEGEIVTYK